MDQSKLERNCERASGRVSSVCKGTLRTHGSKRYEYLSWNLKRAE
jgi:hypothetical protein